MIEYFALSNLGEIITGKTPPKNEPLNWNGKIPFVTPKELENYLPVDKSNDYVTDFAIKKMRLLPKNSILICCIGSLGKIGITNIPLITNQQINSIVFNPKKVFYKYGYYACSRIHKQLEKESSTTVIKIVNKTKFSRIQIPIPMKDGKPDIDEQKRIASILDKADKMRKKRKESINLLDNFIKSTFIDMFGDIHNNKKNLPIKRLEEISSKITDGTHQSPNFTSEGIPFILISNIIDNKISYNTKKFINDVTYNELTRITPIEIGDILYTTVGSYGNPALVLSNNKFCFQRHIAQIKPLHKVVNSTFLYAQLMTPCVKRQADQRVKGVAQKTLNLSELKQIKVILPPIELQNKFAEIVKKTEIIKEKYLRSSQELDNLFNSLSQKAFKGELKEEKQ